MQQRSTSSQQRSVTGGFESRGAIRRDGVLQLGYRARAQGRCAKCFTEECTDRVSVWLWRAPTVGPSRRAGSSPHIGRDYAVEVIVNGGLARDNLKKVCDEGIRLDASIARSVLPVAPVSSKVVSYRKATPGTALATGTHEDAQQKALVSYKAALCNGLEAATTNRTSRNSVKLATPRGAGGASECKGSRTVSIGHKVAVRGECESCSSGTAAGSNGVPPVADPGGGHSAAACSSGAAARSRGVSPAADLDGGPSEACSSRARARSSGGPPTAATGSGHSAVAYSSGTAARSNGVSPVAATGGGRSAAACSSEAAPRSSGLFAAAATCGGHSAAAWSSGATTYSSGVPPAADLGNGHSTAVCSSGAEARGSGVVSPVANAGGDHSAASCSSGVVAHGSGVSPAADIDGGHHAVACRNEAAARSSGLFAAAATCGGHSAAACSSGAAARSSGGSPAADAGGGHSAASCSSGVVAHGSGVSPAADIDWGTMQQPAAVKLQLAAVDCLQRLLHVAATAQNFLAQAKSISGSMALGKTKTGFISKLVKLDETTSSMKSAVPPVKNSKPLK